MKGYVEWPIGVTPHNLEHTDRIQNLSEAILRYVLFIDSGNITLSERVECYRLISKWAKEIEALAEMEITMLAEETK